MGHLFSMSEIMKFALEKEEQAYEFYKNQSSKAPSEPVRELCGRLMLEEHNHMEFFSGMAQAFKERQSPGVKEDDEYRFYLQEMIESSRVRSADYEDFEAKDAIELLKYGIEREKDSILFYHGLKKMVDKTAAETLDTIIEQESMHIAALSDLKKHL